MIHINIIGKDPYHKFDVQWDQTTFPSTEYNIQFDSTDDIEWDLVAVYENMKDATWHGKCRKGGLVYISGEPPMMHPLPTTFTRQFDVFVGPHPKHKHPNKLITHGFLNWSLGFGFFSKQKRYSFLQLRDLEVKKTKPLSIVTSTKRMMPGHNLRQNVIARLKRDFGDQIDFYGVGEKDVDFKADALLPYYFHICMENCEVKNYWTEKFSDPILAKTVPVYCGCPNIDDYFNKEGYIKFSFDDYRYLHDAISRILENTEAEYNKRKDAMLINRDIIMNKENLIPFLIDIANQNRNTTIVDRIIKRLYNNPQGLAFMRIRILRFIQKYLINIRNRFSI